MTQSPFNIYITPYNKNFRKGRQKRGEVFRTLQSPNNNQPNRRTSKLWRLWFRLTGFLPPPYTGLSFLFLHFSLLSLSVWLRVLSGDLRFSTTRHNLHVKIEKETEDSPLPSILDSIVIKGLKKLLMGTICYVRIHIYVYAYVRKCIRPDVYILNVYI